MASQVKQDTGLVMATKTNSNEEEEEKEEEVSVGSLWLAGRRVEQELAPGACGKSKRVKHRRHRPHEPGSRERKLVRSSSSSSNLSLHLGALSFFRSLSSASISRSSHFQEGEERRQQSRKQIVPLSSSSMDDIPHESHPRPARLSCGARIKVDTLDWRKLMPGLDQKARVRD